MRRGYMVVENVRSRSQGSILGAYRARVRRIHNLLY